MRILIDRDAAEKIFRSFASLQVAALLVGVLALLQQVDAVDIGKEVRLLQSIVRGQNYLHGDGLGLRLHANLLRTTGKTLESYRTANGALRDWMVKRGGEEAVERGKSAGSPDERWQPIAWTSSSEEGRALLVWAGLNDNPDEVDTFVESRVDVAAEYMSKLARPMKEVGIGLLMLTEFKAPQSTHCEITRRARAYMAGEGLLRIVFSPEIPQVQNPKEDECAEDIRVGSQQVDGLSLLELVSPRTSHYPELLDDALRRSASELYGSLEPGAAAEFAEKQLAAARGSVKLLGSEFSWRRLAEALSTMFVANVFALLLSARRLRGQQFNAGELPTIVFSSWQGRLLLSTILPALIVLALVPHFAIPIAEQVAVVVLVLVAVGGGIAFSKDAGVGRGESVTAPKVPEDVSRDKSHRPV